MSRQPSTFSGMLFIIFSMACVASCMDGGGGCESSSPPVRERYHTEYIRQDDGALQAELDATRHELMQAERRAAQAEERADMLLSTQERERSERHGAEYQAREAETDAWTAVAVAVSLSVLVLLMAFLLVREHRARRTVSALVRWILRRRGGEVDAGETQA